MRIKQAVIGSRWGHDEAALTAYLYELPRDTILISGGAEGADQHAESLWRMLGGEVWSLRAVEDEETKLWGVESHIFPRGGLPQAQRLEWSFVWKDKRSALLYRDWMIAFECDRLMAFYRPGGSPGTTFTLTLADDIGREVNLQERSLK